MAPLDKVYLLRSGVPTSMFLYAIHICLLALGYKLVIQATYLSLQPLINLITNAYGIWTVSIEQELERIAWTLWKNELNQEFCNDNDDCAKSP